jgi:hypothetical protein
MLCFCCIAGSSMLVGPEAVATRHAVCVQKTAAQSMQARTKADSLGSFLQSWHNLHIYCSDHMQRGWVAHPL